jgi:cytochrome P450
MGADEMARVLRRIPAIEQEVPMEVYYDPYDADFHADPHPCFHRLRAHDPVHFHEGTGSWLVTRYDDVFAGLSDRRLSADRFHLADSNLQAVPLLRALGSMMLFKDPPAHTRMRSLVSKAFTPRAVSEMRPRTQAIAAELLGRCVELGEMDVIADFAAPLPVTVIAAMLGIPPSDYALFKRWSDDLVKTADGTLAAAASAAAERSAAELGAYLDDAFAARRRAPRDDLISRLVAARDDDDALSNDELFATCALLLIAGHETTTNLIGNGLFALLRHPEQLALLRRQPGRVAAAVEELLRFEAPFQITSRVAAEDFELRGKNIRKGQEVVLCLTAANRDPSQFADPDRLDVLRPDVQHVAFGHGIHFCLGAALARIEGQVAIEALIRLPGLGLTVAKPTWKPGIALRGLEALPVRFEPRTAAVCYAADRRGLEAPDSNGEAR